MSYEFYKKRLRYCREKQPFLEMDIHGMTSMKLLSLR